MIAVSTPLIVALLVSTVLPLASSLVTTVKMPPEVAGLVTLALSTVTGFVAEWAKAGDAFNWRAAAATAALSFLTAAVARARIWLGSRLDAKLLSVGGPAVETVLDKVDRLTGGAVTGLVKQSGDDGYPGVETDPHGMDPYHPSPHPRD